VTVRRKRLFCIASALLVALTATLPVRAATPAEEASDKAVAVAKSWLALVDDGDYPKSWEESAALFKRAITKEKWEEALGASRQPLGDLISRTVKSTQYATSLPGAPDGEYVVIQFETSFANKKSAIETVTPMKDPDGEWRVSGYFIK
jgi:hypothetical protein